MEYITPDAIIWARQQLEELPKDQVGLVFALIASAEPFLSYEKDEHDDPQSFRTLFNRYLGAPLIQGVRGVFVPFDSKWRADEYLMSTVMGRLLNGSHWWTGSEGFITRTPVTGWPAKLAFDQRGFEILRKRMRPPCLTGGRRLPIEAMAIWYFRHEAIPDKTLSQLVERYRAAIATRNVEILKLFEDEGAIFWGNLTRAYDLNTEELNACYPGLQEKLSPKITVELDRLVFDQLMHAAGERSINTFITELLEGI